MPTQTKIMSQLIILAKKIRKSLDKKLKIIFISEDFGRRSMTVIHHKSFDEIV